MNRVRVVEIIEAYGGHSDAWPDGERAAAEATVNSDASLATMVADAKALDRALSDWAGEWVPVTMDDADRAATRVLGLRPDIPARRWLPQALVGGALAASLAIGAVMLSRPDTVPGAPQAEIALGDLPGENVEAAQDMLVLGSVFTPTPEEEMML